MNKYVMVSAMIAMFCAISVLTHAETAQTKTQLKTIEALVSETQNGVTYISIEEMKKRIEKNEKLVLLDVRTEREYAAAHIKGAAWIERGLVEFVLVRTLPIQDAEIIVYCKKGYRAGLVVKALKSAGYTNVVGLEGGFDGYVNQGNTVHNFLGEFKMVALNKINASSFATPYYENKKP